MRHAAFLGVVLGPWVSARAAVTLRCEPDRTVVTGGDVITAECFIRSDEELRLRAVQLDLPCSLSAKPGATGGIISLSIGVDTQHVDPPFLFGVTGITATNQNVCTAAATIPPGVTSVVLPAGQERYLATIRYQVLSCAAGTFTLGLENFSDPPLPTDGTRIRGEQDVLVPFITMSQTISVDVGRCCADGLCVGVVNRHCCFSEHGGAEWDSELSCDDPCRPCAEDAECNDDNLCTSDFCMDGGCVNAPNILPCDDGRFCTAVDECRDRRCLGSGDPCPGRICFEHLDVCGDFECFTNADCEDGDPCTTGECNGGFCIQRTNSADCDDGLYCTAVDVCSAGLCVGSGSPCLGFPCDEETDVCIGAPQVRLQCEPDHSSVTGEDTLVATCTIVSDQDIHLRAVQIDLPCSLAPEGKTTGAITNTSVAIDLSHADPPVIFPGGFVAANLVECFAAIVPPIGTTSVLLPANQPRYVATLTYHVDACAAGRFRLGLENFHRPPLGGDGTRIADELRRLVPFYTDPKVIAVEIGRCCRGSTCRGDLNEYCCTSVEQGTWNSETRCVDGCAPCAGDADCDDGNTCTIDACDEGVCLHEVHEGTCDDGRFCTAQDRCENGICVGTGNPCVGRFCNEETDACTDFECSRNADCNDRNVCTTDTCRAGRCVHAANNLSCNDGLFCTTQDSCREGICTGRAPSPCAAGTYCREETDACMDTEQTLAIRCVPAVKVATGDTEVEVICLIESSADLVLRAVQVQVPCSLPGSPGSVGFVSATDIVVDSTHQDPPALFPNGLAATNLTLCQFAVLPPPGMTAGLLPASEPRYLGTLTYRVSDCASGEFSIAPQGISRPPAATDPTRIRDQHNGLLEFSAGVGTIVVPTGRCCRQTECVGEFNEHCCRQVHGGTQWTMGTDCDEACLCTADSDCDDGNTCTTDICDGGVCRHEHNSSSCDDGRFCTLVDACVDGTCFGSGDPCPGQACSERLDACVDQECSTGTDCNDDNVCTTDLCKGGLCVNMSNTAPCEDGSFCTASDICKAGLCRSGSGTPCGENEFCDEAADECVPFGQLITLRCRPDNSVVTGSGTATATCTIHSRAEVSLRATQLDLPTGLPSKPGAMGSVDGRRIWIDPNHADPPFLFGLSGIGVVNTIAFLAAATPPPGVTGVTLAANEERYLATVEYQASECAAGTFRIGVENFSAPPTQSDGTRIRDAMGMLLPFNAVSEPVEVQVGRCCRRGVCLGDLNEHCCRNVVNGTSWNPEARCADGCPCSSDEDCDDQDACTTDACVEGICGHQPPPDGRIISSQPPAGTLDARQPNPPGDDTLEARQGIGRPDEPIFVQLNVPGASRECFWLCESHPDPVFGPNSIESVTEIVPSVYRLELARPITPGAVTTISYRNISFVSFTSHPTNANADRLAGVFDLVKLIDYLNGVDLPPHGLYSTDMDHSGVFQSKDIMRMIDLFNGTPRDRAWNGTARPIAPKCP